MLIYVFSIILTLVLVKIPFVSNIYLKDKYFAEIILDLLMLIWFCVILSKQFLILEWKIDYKKVFHLYLLNIGIYIGASLCFFTGDRSMIKNASAMYINFSSNC